MKNILQKTKAFFKEIFFFLSSKIFLKNISFMVIAVVSFFALAYFSLNWLTFHGKFTETPEVVGLNLKEIKKKYNNFSFHIDSAAFDKDIEPFTIITQDPYPGEKIKHNRTIYITVSPIQPPFVSLPNIYGKRLELALKALKDKKFRTKIYRFENDKADSTILKMIYFNPLTGDSTVLAEGKNAAHLPEGSTVHLVVARGLGAQVLLPNLLCSTYDVAQFLLEGSDLQVGNVFTDGVVSDSTNAYISRQNPPYLINRMIKKGQEVDIWLSSTPPANCGIDDVDVDASSSSTSTDNSSDGNNTNNQAPSTDLRVRTGRSNE